MSNILRNRDFIAAGFERIDDRLLEQHPPMIQWGQLYRDMGQKKKIRYLERLASAMNHAAAKLQTERDALQELCERKERQLVTMKRAVDANNDMLQSEVTRLNEDRQQMLQEVSRLKAELRATR